MNEHDKPCFSERAGSITSGRAKTTFLSIPRGRSRPVQHSPVSAWITGLAPVAFAVWVATVGLPPAAFAQSPQLINYQGRLLSGTNLVNGNVGLALRLFNVPVGGSALYVDSNTVPVADGLYSTFIGDNTVSGSLADALANPSVWIEVAVNGVALAPRERLASAAYAVGAWNVNGNAGTTSNSFIGTTDLTPLEMRVNGMRAMRLEYTPFAANDTTNLVNVIGGSSVNSVGPGVSGATISGGGAAGAFGGIMPNRVNAPAGTIAGGMSLAIESGADYSAIGGGSKNTISTNSPLSVIAGGSQNTISNGAYGSTISGGQWNTIAANAFGGTIAGGQANKVTSAYGAIPGGLGNEAGTYSFAAGSHATARHQGSFVWADSSSAVPFITTADNQFLIRSAGGVGINVTNPVYELDIGGRARFRQEPGGATAGFWLYQKGPANDRAFIGMDGDGYVGWFGNPGLIWGLVMNVTNGNVGIGTATPGYKLEVNGSAHRVDNSASWTITSDRRLKTGIEPLGDALVLLERVRPVNFFYNDVWRAANPGLPAAQQFGVIAQEFQEVFPDFVKTNAAGYLTVDSSPLTFVNSAAIQALDSEVRNQQSEVSKLQTENAELKTELGALKARLEALEQRR